jgi:hypothetical protein
MRSALLALATVLTVTGCAGATLSPQQDAVGTVQTFLTQCARDRPLAVMHTLVPAAQHEFVSAGRTRAGCARVLGTRGLVAGTPRLRSFNGSQAVVVVGGVPVRLAYGEGFWRIEAA